MASNEAEARRASIGALGIPNGTQLDQQRGTLFASTVRFYVDRIGSNPASGEHFADKLSGTDNGGILPAAILIREPIGCGGERAVHKQRMLQKHENKVRHQKATENVDHQSHISGRPTSGAWAEQLPGQLSRDELPLPAYLANCSGMIDYSILSVSSMVLTTSHALLTGVLFPQTVWPTRGYPSLAITAVKVSRGHEHMKKPLESVSPAVDLSGARQCASSFRRRPDQASSIRRIHADVLVRPLKRSFQGGLGTTRMTAGMTRCLAVRKGQGWLPASEALSFI